MKQVFIKIAEGYQLIQEGYSALAEYYSKDIKENGAKAKEVVKEQTEEKAVGLVNIEEVRAVMAAKSRDGKTQEVRKLINEFGAEKLSSVSKEKLPELLQKAEEL